MRCSKCNTENNNNEKFCKNCGFLLQTQNIENNLNNKEYNNQITEEITEEKIEQIINPNTKKYAIISILIGIGGICFSFIVGMSLWLSLVLSSLGFTLAKKGSNHNLLSIIGYVVNGILLAIGIIIYICLITGIVE